MSWAWDEVSRESCTCSQSSGAALSNGMIGLAAAMAVIAAAVLAALYGACCKPYAVHLNESLRTPGGAAALMVHRIHAPKSDISHSVMPRGMQCAVIVRIYVRRRRLRRAISSTAAHKAAELQGGGSMGGGPAACSLFIEDGADGCWVTFAEDIAGKRVPIGQGAFSKVKAFPRAVRSSEFPCQRLK